jgi:hypothetical protein
MDFSTKGKIYASKSFPNQKKEVAWSSLSADSPFDALSAANLVSDMPAQ